MSADLSSNLTAGIFAAHINILIQMMVLVEVSNGAELVVSTNTKTLLCLVTFVSLRLLHITSNLRL